MKFEKQLRIRQPFQAQYNLLVELDALLINSHLKSLTEIRYDFSVLSVQEDFFECRLIQLDISIRESNNPLIIEVAAVTAAFNKLFTELHLRLSHEGKVLEIVNIDLVLKKWESVKKEMQNAASTNEDIKNIISLNDSVFTNPEKIKTAVQANEFLQVYFGQSFGISLPVIEKLVLSNNFLNTANLYWHLDAESYPSLPTQNKVVEVITTVKPSNPLRSDFSKLAYKQFEDKINLEELKPVLQHLETRNIEIETGKMNDVMIKKSEFVLEKQLHHYLNYHLISDSHAASIKDELEETSDRDLANNDPGDRKSRFLFD